MQKALFAVFALIAGASAAHADTYVNGYMRGNGTYVAPHMRSDADGSRSNNWSTQGNVNPYTGSTGTHNPNRW